MRSDMWKEPTPPWIPTEPTTSPRATVCPFVTVADARYEYEVRTVPPWRSVTEIRPATLPTKVTVPLPMARTGEPWAVATSAPQWPDHTPVGPNGRTMAEPGPSPSPKQAGTMAMTSDELMMEAIIWHHAAATPPRYDAATTRASALSATPPALSAWCEAAPPARRKPRVV